MSSDDELDDILKEVKEKQNNNNNANNNINKNKISQDEIEEETPNDFSFNNDGKNETTLKESEIEEINNGVNDNTDKEENPSELGDNNMGKNKKKKLIIIIVAILAIIAIGAGVFFAVNGKEEEPITAPITTTTTTEAPVVVTNPLTGEPDYNTKAVNKRPVACVVENTVYARPQWGITTPDIIVEGEVEGGITRMLWLYSDYSSLPDEIGPMRSARPSYVKFSEYFDSIFVHWGGSHSKTGYTGGYETIANDDVDDLDGMSDSGFGRDNEKAGNGVEHTGVFYGGQKAVDAIKKADIRTKIDADATSTLHFYDSVSKVGNTACNNLSLKISSKCSEIKKFSYNSSDGLYHNTANYKTDVTFENLIILYDETKYINVPYKSSNVTYVNYQYTGTTGKLISNGTATDIKWEVKDNKIALYDTDGNDLQLNVGNSWICLANSSNNVTTIS